MDRQKHSSREQFMFLYYDDETFTGKISAQPHPTLCIQFLNRGNNDKNNTFPLGKQICFTIVWGCAETLPIHRVVSSFLVRGPTI